MSYTLTQDYEYIIIYTARSFFRIPNGSTVPNSFEISSGAYSLLLSSGDTPIFDNGAIKIYKDIKSGTQISATNYSSQNAGVQIWLALHMSIYTY